MGPVEPDEITSLGFMLSDKIPGSFKMRVESLSVLRTEN
jgi:hypothetical protein